VEGQPVDRPLNKLLSQMSMELADFRTTDETVETVAEYARIAVDADEAGVMLVRARGKVETPAGTSKDVDKAHQLQAEYGEGPCLEAIDGGEDIYTVSNTLGDERWPLWGKAAADLGFYSVVSASLHTDTRRIGSLNVYSRSVDAFDDKDAEVIKLLAGHATVAIAAAKAKQELHEALDSRTTIGQAQGVLMQSFDIDAATAFAYMRRLSQHQNVKLVRVAESLIENRPKAGTDLDG
jgi:transcriptional regulator with GAF, ATPase, and Fis domain